MKPMMFNMDMAKAVQEGRKNVTRRAIKPKYRDDEFGFQVILKKPSNEFVHVEVLDEFEEPTRILTPPYSPGDICYIPEPWKYARAVGTEYAVIDFRDGEDMLIRFDSPERAEKWRKYLDKPRANWQSPYFMPREAARKFLRVTGIRVEPLQVIWDFRAEGIETSSGCDMCFAANHGCDPANSACGCDNEVEAFAKLWDSTMSPSDREEYGWEADPWVWVIEFERISSSEAYRADIEAAGPALSPA